MHQQSRHPPRGISPATPSQTNPTRTNNPRDARDAALGSRSRAASEAAYPGTAIEAGAGDAPSGNTATTAASTTSLLARPSRESIKKLDQIIQNFYLKAAVLIIQSRIPVTISSGSRGKTNKWFQIETDDIEDFRDELRIWKHSGSFDNRPPPMIIETYLDASRLAAGQVLAVVDENGKRCDALESLNASDLSASGSGSDESGSGRSDDNSNSNKIRTRSTEIILERWKVELRCIPNLLKSTSGNSGNSGNSGGSAGDDNAGGKGHAEAPSNRGGADMEMDDFGPTLPTIYKRSIVFFRSLFVTTNVLPAYRFSRQATKKSVHPALQVRARVLTGKEAEARISANGFDTLRQPLFYDGGRDAVTDYMFGDLEVPIGRFSASVTYRNSCSFSIVDSESLLSSRFMGIDENYFRPSLQTAQRADSSYSPRQQPHSQQQHPRQHHQQQHHKHNQHDPHRRRESSVEVVGSLPQHLRHGHHAAEHTYQPPPQQTYGSLSTFHGPGALGTSPLSALKAVRPAGSESSSPTDSIRPSSRDQLGPQFDPPNSLPISAGRHASAPFSGLSPASSISARPPALRNLDGVGRRSSVSFNPFKAGSLSGSPRVSQDEIMQMPSSPLSGSRPMSGISALAQARNRSSLTAGMAASLRGAPSISTSVGSPSTAAAAMMAIDLGAGSSPRPSAGSRYSSSFTHRRGRSSFGGTSRGEDDQGSSGKQSLASSMAQPGSGLLAEAGGVGSSGSFQTDDDNISDFLKALESKKTLQSFELSSRRGESARRTVAQLSRYQLMRESNVALTDSMNSSMQLPSRLLSSSTRQPGGTVSGLSGSLVGTGSGGAGVNPSPSMSPSLSPKPLSPHTPHTPHAPAVPSRLSGVAVIDYQGPTHVRPRPGRQVSNTTEEEADADDDEDEGEERTHTGGGGTTAIDIPVSPRPLLKGGGGSAAAKTRTLAVDDSSADLAAFGGQRSLSATAEDREPVSPGALFRLEGESGGSGETSTSASGVGGRAGSAAGILRPSSGGALRRRSNGAGDGARTAASSMPPALSAAATALRSVTASSPAPGTSQRRRYTSRLQQNDSSGARGGSSEGRPTTPHMSRGSMSGSFSGRYSGGSGRGSGGGQGGGGGGDGEAEEEILVFDLLEFGT